MEQKDLAVRSSTLIFRTSSYYRSRLIEIGVTTTKRVCTRQARIRKDNNISPVTTTTTTTMSNNLTSPDTTNWRKVALHLHARNLPRNGVLQVPPNSFARVKLLVVSPPPPSPVPISPFSSSSSASSFSFSSPNKDELYYSRDSDRSLSSATMIDMGQTEM